MSLVWKTTLNFNYWISRKQSWKKLSVWIRDNGEKSTFDYEHVAGAILFRIKKNGAPGAETINYFKLDIKAPWFIICSQNVIMPCNKKSYLYDLVQGVPEYCGFLEKQESHYSGTNWNQHNTLQFEITPNGGF